MLKGNKTMWIDFYDRLINLDLASDIVIVDKMYSCNHTVRIKMNQAHWDNQYEEYEYIESAYITKEKALEIVARLKVLLNIQETFE
jgi:hypothetical protein